VSRRLRVRAVAESATDPSVAFGTPSARAGDQEIR
jgi:hypothetical protein